MNRWGILTTVFSLFSFTSIMGQELKITTIWATKGPQSLPFQSVAGVCTTNHGDIWVADSRNATVYIFDPGGHLIKNIGAKGDGPGEFQAPALISAINPETVVVYDIARKSFEVFDSAGTFTHRVHHGIQVLNPKSFLAQPDSTFLLSGGIWGNEYSIHSISWDGKLLSSQIQRPKTENDLASLYLAGGPIAGNPEEVLYFSRASRPQIIMIPAGGESRQFSRNPTGFPTTGDDFLHTEGERTYMRWYFPRPTGVFLLGGGGLLQVVSFREEERSLWEIYDGEGDLKSSTLIPVAYFPWAFMPNGDQILTRVDPETGETELLRVRLEGVSTGI